MVLVCQDVLFAGPVRDVLQKCGQALRHQVADDGMRCRVHTRVKNQVAESRAVPGTHRVVARVRLGQNVRQERDCDIGHFPIFVRGPLVHHLTRRQQAVHAGLQFQRSHRCHVKMQRYLAGDERTDLLALHIATHEREQEAG